MDAGDVDVVVWPESAEREVWWRQIVERGRADGASATRTPNRSAPDALSRILRAA